MKRRSTAGYLRAATLLPLAGLLLIVAPLPAQEQPRVRELATEGRLALREDRPAQALGSLEEAARLAPSDPDILSLLGRVYEQLDRPEEAVATYRRALEASPTHADSRHALERLGTIGWSSSELLDRADRLASQERWSEALYLYRRFLEDQPESVRALEGQSRCERGLEGLEDPSPPTEAVAAPAPSLPPVPEPNPEVAVEGPQAQPPPQKPPSVEPATGPRELSSSPPPPVAAADPIVIQESAEEPSTQKSPAPAEEIETSAIPPSAPPSEPAPSTSPPSTYLLLLVAALGVLVLAIGLFSVWRFRRSCTVRGNLEQFPLTDLLQWLDIGKKIGVLRITAGTAAGRIHFEAGRMLRAEWSGAEAEEALHKILSLPKGNFVFRERPLPPSLVRNLDLPVQKALMNWAYETDEASREDGEEGLELLEAVDDESLNVHLPF